MFIGRIKYLRRLLSKLSAFAIFGISSLILFILIFPIIHLISGFSSVRFRRNTRKFISFFFRLFIKYIEITGSMKLTVKNKELLKGVKSKIIIANHPSLLDVVILISLIPNADCVVKGNLINSTFISGIIRNLYIPNILSFEEQIRAAEKTMNEGNNLIIFPEGTRSKPGEPWAFKKGAARFALYTKSNIIPVYFGGNEKIGLRKNDKMLSHHPSERHLYNLEVLPEISVETYLKESPIKGPIHLTDTMKSTLEQIHRS